MNEQQCHPFGPVLILDDLAGGVLHLSALFLTEPAAPPPTVEADGVSATATRLSEYGRATVWRARFSLPADRPSSYAWKGEVFEVAGDLSGDLRLAYVSCNGEETGDLEREGSERNAMWARLGREHRERPFALLLHGGDQVYADEVTRGHALSHDWPDRYARNPSDDALQDLRHHLRQRFVERYSALYSSPDIAWLLARVPSLMQWDDHDICDGWGSLSRSRTGSSIGQAVFEIARESFLVFQQGTTDGDLPARFGDPQGRHLGWCVRAPNLRLLAPDLRSERTRRRIVGPEGWAMLDREADRPAPGQTFVLSSVPLLGPRLSLLEFLMVVIPGMQKYEDDLRDQWQSRAHREEWRRMLRLVQAIGRRDGQDITAVSGEIHLATRATMQREGGTPFHQLVASGIAHRAPPAAWARTLGALAWLGEAPLPDHPIRVEPLPGLASRYIAERNYLILERTSDRWSARWDLEASGMTDPLPLSSDRG
jgi:hypothetical protein